jgi:hypothetical protein
MQVRYHDHGQITDEVRAVVEYELRVLEQRLADIADDLKLLTVTVEHHLRDDSYTSHLVLEVPNRAIAARGDGRARGVALRDAFGDLLDEVDEYLAKLRNEPGERLEGKFHLSAQELHKGALREIEEQTRPGPG